MPDYRALPFVSSANPYYEVLGGPDALPPVAHGRSPGRRLRLELAAALHVRPRRLADFRRHPQTGLRHSRDPFWTSVTSAANGTTSHFRSDRTSIYALGYPAPTMFAHLSRLSEVTVVVAGFFVLLLGGRGSTRRLRDATTRPCAVLYPRDSGELLPQAVPVLRARGRRPVLLFAAGVRRLHDRQVSGRRRSGSRRASSPSRGRVFEELAPRSRPVTRSPRPTTSWLDPPGDRPGRQSRSKGRNSSRPASATCSTRACCRRARRRRSIGQSRSTGCRRFVAADRSGTFAYLVAGGAGASALARSPNAVADRAAGLAPARDRAADRRAQPRRARGRAWWSSCLPPASARRSPARVSDPVARLTRATRLIAAGRLDVRIAADTADELGRLVDDFNSMARRSSRSARSWRATHQLKAWAEMARQVAHEIKNPLTPIQLAAEHLQRVHETSAEPLGPVFDQCVTTILRQVRLLRQIASEFSTFAGAPTRASRPSMCWTLSTTSVDPYRFGVEPGASRCRRCASADCRRMLRRFDAGRARADEPDRERRAGDARRRHVAVD